MASTGRFLQQDPEEGGTPNAYVYPPDPINWQDVNGLWGMPKWAKKAGSWAWEHKVDIALTALVFVPGVGMVSTGARVAIMASRAASAARAARAAKAAAMAAKAARAARAAAAARAARASRVAQAAAAARRAKEAAERAYYNSKTFGRTSKLYGAKQLGAKTSGLFNNNNFYRIGWSTHRGYKTLRITIGPHGWSFRPHIDIIIGRF